MRPAHGVDETVRAGESPEAYVRRLAREKALATPRGAGETVLAADTTVVLEGEILGKPEDPAEATRMLSRLAGRAHEVWTGICLLGAGLEVVDAAVSRVWFLHLSPAEIAAYIASGEPWDKAGGYGIQGLASKFVDRIEGCYYNVMGLPVSLVYRHLRRTADTS